VFSKVSCSSYADDYMRKVAWQIFV